MAVQKMQLVDWLDDLCVRFIINLPQEELESVARICFQVEEAQWFYEDFIRPIDPTLPSLNLRDFCLRIFQHCPLLSAFSDSQHLAAYQEFLGYKTRVPVRGAIMLNDAMDEVVLVKGWKKGASWSFPRGKINKDEPDLDCAVREVWEETGYDIQAAGLVPDPQDVKAIDVTMREQHMRLFVFRNVPTDTHFEPRTRKEISKIQWYKLSDLPTFKKNKNPTLNQNADIVNANKFYMVAPFLVPLKKWINQQRRQDAEQALHYDVHDEEETAATEAVIDEYSPIAAPIEVSQLGVVDPASELKRLLSVGGASIAMPPVQPPQEPQANTLLAMLRGNGANHLQPPQMAGTLPTTPMEQMTGYPAQPPSPHYHHPHESPDIRRQPPPHFPFNTSPQWNENGPDPRFAVGPYVSGNGNRMNMSMPPAQGVFGSQNPGFMPSGHPDGQMQDVQQSNMRPSAFTPQDQQGGLQHGPIAPKASQLPPPKLSGHTMNLLNAFKEESRSSNAGLQAPQGAAASLQSPFVFPAQPRNAHQSSLLDLFRSPSAQHAEPVPTGPSTSSEQQEQPVTAQPSAKIAPQATIQRPVTLGAAQRKSSAVSMITRTLPRVRLDDTHQFPSLGSGSATTLPPSKEAPMPGPWGAVSQKASQQKQPAAHIASGEPMKVMSRPASSAGKIPPKASASVASSPSQRSPSKQDTLGKALAAPIVTILQRPASAKSAVSNGSQRPSASPARAQTEKASKPFQPQLLRREKPEKAASPRTESTPTNDAPKDNTNQRNALLALFAKNAQGSSQPLITSQPSTTKQAEQPTAAQLIPAPVATNEDTPSTAQKAAPRGAAAWNNFAVQAQAAEAQPKAPEQASRPEQVSVSQQRWKETFKQTPIEENWMGGPRKVVNVEKTIHGEEVPKEAVAKTSPVPTGTPFDEMSRSRMGSRASIASAGALREGMKSPTTPLEAKDFLLDFLNGVAKGGR